MQNETGCAPFSAICSASTSESFESLERIWPNASSQPTPTPEGYVLLLCGACFMCASPRLGSRENGYNHACCIYRVTRRRREWGRCRGWWAIAEMRKNNTSKFKHAPERAPCYHCNNFFFRRQCSGFFIDGFAGLFGDWKSYYPIIPVLGSRY